MNFAVLVIDVQEELFAKEDLPAEAELVIARINDLTDRARQVLVPVIWVQHESEKGGLVYGSPGWQLQADVVRKALDITIRKTTPDSFLRTDLEAKLRSLLVDHLIICGYSSEFCVDTTVRKAAALGFTVTLAADAHTSHDKLHLSGVQIREHHNLTLSHITSFGVKISYQPAKDIVFE